MSGTNTATLNTGEYRVYDGGNAWEVIASTELLRVESIKDGRTIRKDDFAEVGSYDRYQQYYGSDVRAFDAVKVTALTDNTTFTLSVSDGQSGKNLVSNEVERIVQAVNVAELSGGRLASVGAIDALDLSGLGAHHGTATNAVQTLVSPASNVNGVVLHHVAMGANSATQEVCYGTTAPANYLDTGRKALAVSRANAHTPFYKAIKIPAGNGLYLVGNGSLNSEAATVIWEVL